MDPAVQATLVAAAATGSTPHPGQTRDLPDGLTPREAEILAMISRGMTNPEIAHALVLSNHTVKSHINRIFTKTGSRDRAAATQYAQARNLQ
jgi:DNA-binding NarL/FixJ family response regulator